MAGGEKHPGMMGDGTEEQNLGQPGDPSARVTKDDVETAFGEQQAPEVGGSGNVPGRPGSGVADDTQPSDVEPIKDNTH